LSDPAALAPLAPAAAAKLYEVARALAGALTTEEVAAAVFERALADLGASSVGLWLVDAGAARFAGGAGIVHDPGLPVWVMPLDSDLPAATCIRERRPMFYGSLEERDQRWPALAATPDTSQALAALPLTAGARVIGCLHIGYARRLEPSEFDRPLLGRLAELCGAALDRARLHDAGRDHQALLLDASAAVAGAAGYAETLHRLASVAVPRIADLCLIDVREGAGSRVRIVRMAAVSADPASADLVSDLASRYPPDLSSAHPAAQAMAQKTSVWSGDVDDEFLRRTTHDDRHFELAKALGFRSYMSVPLIASDEAIGAMTFVSAGSGRRFDGSDLHLAESLAARVADAVAGARRHEREHNLAQTLQRLLLPAELPEFEGLEVEARYVTAQAGADAGGDFFDVVRLPSGRAGFMIGDVEGHDTVAAATMGQVRSATRALAGQHREPSEVAHALRWSWDLLGFSRMATLVLGRLDPTDGCLSLASLGHLPPIIIDREGRARFVQVHNSPPLGAPGGSTDQAELNLGPGETLFLYTDGLVEQGSAGIDAQLEDLRVLLEGQAGSGLDELCDGVLAARSGAEGQADDIAILAMRRRS
jgi:GAF domain-containing protein